MPPGPGTRPSTGRRVPKHPLIEIARADRKEDALAEVERWKERHPDVAAVLDPADVLVDAMRGQSSTWTRVRVNLKNVPEDERRRLTIASADEVRVKGREAERVTAWQNRPKRTPARARKGS
jgi:hypothetical protein